MVYFVTTRDYLIGRKKYISTKQRVDAFIGKIIKESIEWYKTQEKEKMPTRDDISNSIDVITLAKEEKDVFIPEMRAYQYGKVPLNVYVSRMVVYDL